MSDIPTPSYAVIGPIIGLIGSTLACAACACGIRAARRCKEAQEKEQSYAVAASPPAAVPVPLPAQPPAVVPVPLPLQQPQLQPQPYLVGYYRPLTPVGYYPSPYMQTQQPQQQQQPYTPKYTV